MDRPALKRLLADIEAGKIDCVVVYEVDRLSRSLLDFARMMEVFEKRGVSFVSVTQQFNTASSMGRQVLNVLLSFAYQAGIFKQWESQALVIGGVEDHVHALFSLSKNYALKKIVEELKNGSSKWMKTNGTKNGEFHWQNEYAAFSVSESNIPDIRRYIENQREHHRKMTFQDELRALPTRHGVEFEERYVWD